MNAPTKEFFRIYLGKKNAFAPQCFAENVIGVDFQIREDLTGKLPDEWRAFNKTYIPVYLKEHPDKTKVAAGLSCGFLWTVSKGLKNGDVILSPDGAGQYRVGIVSGDYKYNPEHPLPHQRAVQWTGQSIGKAAMSEGLKNSCGSIGTVCRVTSHADEIQKLLGGSAPALVAADPTVEDATAFALETHLEEFLVQNWSHTELGKHYDIYEEEDENGQQYPTDTGPLDILAISKDRKRLLVVELKKGRASDSVVGQVLRYMSYVQDELAEADQTVHGVIIALEDDQKIRRALAMVPNVEFFRYQVSFKLVKS